MAASIFRCVYIGEKKGNFCPNLFISALSAKLAVCVGHDERLCGDILL